jgi:NTP pyrophosphatase (non-canonical NTP hydrolase)
MTISILFGISTSVLSLGLLVLAYYLRDLKDEIEDLKRELKFQNKELEDCKWQLFYLMNHLELEIRKDPPRMYIIKKANK